MRNKLKEKLANNALNQAIFNFAESPWPSKEEVENVKAEMDEKGDYRISHNGELVSLVTEENGEIQVRYTKKFTERLDDRQKQNNKKS